MNQKNKEKSDHSCISLRQDVFSFSSSLISFIFSRLFWKTESVPYAPPSCQCSHYSLCRCPGFRRCRCGCPGGRRRSVERLYSLDLVRHHNRVLLADLGRGLRLVVIRTAVLVRVPVDPAKQVATATVESWWAQWTAVSKRFEMNSKTLAVGKKNLFWSLYKKKKENQPLHWSPACLPVRPTFLRHIKHLFFLGLGGSPLPSSLEDEEEPPPEPEAVGWLTTV